MINQVLKENCNFHRLFAHSIHEGGGKGLCSMSGQNEDVVFDDEDDFDDDDNFNYVLARVPHSHIQKSNSFQVCSRYSRQIHFSRISEPPETTRLSLYAFAWLHQKQAMFFLKNASFFSKTSPLGRPIKALLTHRGRLGWSSRALLTSSTPPTIT